MNKIILLTAIMMLFIAIPVSSTPLSVISSDYLDFDLGLGGPAWIINMRGDSASEYYIFGNKETITADKKGEKVNPASNFELNTKLTQQRCEYNLVQTSRRDIIRYDVKEIGTYWLWNAMDRAQEECINKGGEFAWGESPLLSNPLRQKVFCATPVTIGRAGEVQGAKIAFEQEFRLSKEGDSAVYTHKLSTLTDNKEGIPTNIAIRDGSNNVIAQVRWIGGVTFGEWCPTLGNENIAVDSAQGGWRLTSRESHTLYEQKFLELREFINRFDKKIKYQDAQELKILFTEVNNRASRAMVASRPVSTPYQIVGSKAVLNIDEGRIIYAPDVQIKLNADWLGIRFREGMPKILAADFYGCSEEAQTRNEINVEIQNVGEGRATFDVGLACQDGIVPDATIRTIDLQVNQKGNVNIPFSLEIDKDTKITCTVTVRDQNNIQNVDRKSVSSDCQATRFCDVEGQKTCFGQLEMICKSGLWVNTGSDACRTIPPPPPPPGPDPDDPKLMWAYIIGGVILAIAIFFLFIDKKPKGKGKGPVRSNIRRRKK